MALQETYNEHKKFLSELSSSLSSLLALVQDREDIKDARFRDWQKACKEIRNQITEDIVRVAVVGPIKSGKSTLVNSLFRGDFLKRGAGVVTSIVTRIRSGSHLRATLYFKSWDEVNTDIGQALALFPEWPGRQDRRPFDFRRADDRSALAAALRGLSDDLLVSDGMRNTSSLLLSLYVNGYDRINRFISSDSLSASFTDDQFLEHHTFVGDDSLAVYLRDVELEIRNTSMDRSVEIADCQGSDSPNPLHLAMIQDYLLRSHFIVYVISSRTGLRQADMHFLSMLKKMGIIGNILFVINSDFSEHESLDDLQRVSRKVTEELSLIRPEPDVYTFSALFNLFHALSADLSRRDSLRLQQWEAEDDIRKFVSRESARFETALNEKLTRERFSLLFRSHLERMSVITTGLLRWASLTREIMEKDSDGVSAALLKMQHRLERIHQMKSLINNTLKGAADDIMKNLKVEIDRFFTNMPESVSGRTLTFVNDYRLPLDRYRDKLETSGFSSTLYLMFQEFKQALNTFMAESINPEIAVFSRQIDSQMQSSLESAAGPFYFIASDDLSELKAAVNVPDFRRPVDPESQLGLLDLEVIKDSAGIRLPSAATALSYSARIRTEAFVRLGFYSMTKLFKKVLKKSSENERAEQMRALDDGIRLIKEETAKAIIFHFENYRENFKFQYVLKLLEASSRHLNQILTERFQSFSADIKYLEKVVEKKGAEREEISDFLSGVSSKAEAIRQAMDNERKRLASE